MSWDNSMRDAKLSIRRAERENAERAGGGTAQQVPAWFNWHSYRPHNEELFAATPAQKQPQSLRVQSPLPGAKSSIMSPSTNYHRPGAPRDLTARTPVFERSDAASSLPYNTSRHGGFGAPSAAAMTPSSSRQQQQQQQQSTQPSMAMDQAEWARRFPASSPAAHLSGLGSNRIAAAMDQPSHTKNDDVFFTSTGNSMGFDAEKQKRATPGLGAVIDNESDIMTAASLLPGDRFRPQQQQQQQDLPPPMLPWVPGRTEEFLKAQEARKRQSFLQATGSFTEPAKIKGNDTGPLPPGARAFTVNVITDPLRVGTAGFAEEESRFKHGVVPSADSGASPAAATAVILQNIRAKSVREFAEQVEQRLAEQSRIFMSITGFRYSNLMQTDAWESVSSLVGDELLRQDPRGAIGYGGSGSAADSPHKRGAKSKHATALFGSAQESEKVFNAVSSAAAKAAGSIAFCELPSEISIVPFVSKRRLAFTVTCTNITPAGVSVFPLKEADVLLERRGSAWVSDMETLRTAVGKVTHRDCSAAPMFLVSATAVQSPAASPIEAQFESLPKCELIVGPHQLPPFSCILVTVPAALGGLGRHSSLTRFLPKGGGDKRNNSAYELPDEFGNIVLGVSKRIKTPLAAGLVVNGANAATDHELLRSQQEKYAKHPLDLSGIPLKREEMLSPDRRAGSSAAEHPRPGGAAAASPSFSDPSTSASIVSSIAHGAPDIVSDSLVDPSKYKQAPGATSAGERQQQQQQQQQQQRQQQQDVSNGNDSAAADKPGSVCLVANNSSAAAPPARVGLNLIEHVIAEGMARFGNYIEAGAIKTPNVRRQQMNVGAPEDDPERSLLGVDEASKALLFASDIDAAIAERPLRQFEVPKTRYRRALLQATMHFLRSTQDQEVLSMDALVRSTSDVVDVVLKELEERFGFGDVRGYMLPLGQHEIEAIKRAAARAVRLEIAVAAGNANDPKVPFTKTDQALHRLNAERKLMGLPPLDPAAAGVGGPGGSNFLEMPADSPGVRAMRAARKADERYDADQQQKQRQQRNASSPDGKQEAEVAARLGLPAYEAPTPRKPLENAVMVLTRPQFDLVTKRLVFFATCSVDIFSVASAVVASRFHRRQAGQLQKTSEAAYFRWCFSYGQVTSDQFRAHLRCKDEGAPPPKPIREVPLDALIELGLARVDIVSFSRPTTLALEISLQRAPSSVDGFTNPLLANSSSSSSPTTKNNNKINNKDDNDGGNVGLGSAADSTMDVLQADERYSIYLEVGDDDGGVVHQALTFLLPMSALHPEKYAAEAQRRSELRRGGRAVPKFDEM